MVYKSFRKQYRECKASSILIEVPCIKCSQVNLICKKYNKYCSSGNCIKDRVDKNTYKNWLKIRKKNAKANS